MGLSARCRATRGTLILECPDGRLALRIGAGAEKWAEKIRNPRSRVDKLGIKTGAKVTVLGLEDPKFEKEPAGQDVGHLAPDAEGYRECVPGRPANR